MRISSVGYFTAVLILILISQSLKAQDLIRLNDDQVIHGKVTEISTDHIAYFKAQYPGGPSYHIERKDVCQITYASGRIEFYGKCKRREERAERRRLNPSDWTAGEERIGITAGYSMPLSDFREGANFDGPQALDGFSIGANYFRTFDFLPARLALQVDLNYSQYTARFDTSFGGFDVGGGNDILNIDIQPASWSVIDLDLAVPVLIASGSKFELSIAPRIGLSHVIEPKLSGSSNFFFFNTSFRNTPDQATVFTYGGLLAAHFPIGPKFSTGAFVNYRMGTLVLDTNYEFTINGTTTNEQNQFEYQYSRLTFGVHVVYAL